MKEYLRKTGIQGGEIQARGTKNGRLQTREYQKPKLFNIKEEQHEKTA